MSKIIIDSKDLDDAMEYMKNLESLLNERISDLHNVDGEQADRHAFCYYRQKLWNAYFILRDKTEQLKEPKPLTGKPKK